MLRREDGLQSREEVDTPLLYVFNEFHPPRDGVEQTWVGRCAVHTPREKGDFQRGLTLAQSSGQSKG